MDISQSAASATTSTLNLLRIIWSLKFFAYKLHKCMDVHLKMCMAIAQSDMMEVGKLPRSSTCDSVYSTIQN